MKKYICKVCGKEFKSPQGYSFHYGTHNPNYKESQKRGHEKLKLLRKNVVKSCEKCGNLFEVERTIRDGVEKISKHEKRFCSRECANGRKHSIETKRKISNKVNEYIQEIGIEKYREISKKKSNKNILAIKKCKCGKTLNNHNKSGLCKDCLRSDIAYREKISKSVKGKTGGYIPGSVKNYRSGKFDGIWFDSSWELAFYIYHKENNINIVKNYIGFKYFINDESHNYYPDFIVNSIYYEIKGYKDSSVNEKISQFPINEKIILLEKEEMKPYLTYVKDKYGKEFWKIFYE